MPGYTRRAEKDLDALPAAMQEKARALAGRLDQEPSLGKKLKGKLHTLRSARLGRSHRILYTVVEGRIIVVAITDRKDAYR
jgi:mRNA-degrading endonuclease RelE of RelBE toxin-antitoxin system